LSPDVRQVAFLCYEHDPDNPSRSLRVMANEPGAKSRILVRNREFLYVTPAAWSSDGKAILVQLWRFDNTAQLAWVSAVDGSIRPLKSLEWRQPDRPSVSPAGRYITYSALVRAGSEERHIYVLMADGSGETELVKTAGVNSAPVWMPDGAHILFSSDQSGTPSLWSVPVRNGKAAGVASLVKTDIGRISPIGVTRSGSYYYVQARGGEDVFAADYRDGKVQGITRISDRFVGSNHGAAWSPDGRFMAFKRQRLGQATWLSGYDVVVRSLETGEEKTYAGALTTGMPLRLSWSHDGKAILLGAADKQNRISYQRLDLNTGQWEEIAPGVGIHGAFSPDDKTLYVPSDDFGIVAIEVATGQRRLVASVPDGLGGLAVSPDGRTLALVTAGISGGKERLLLVGTGASAEVIESGRAELQALSPGRTSAFADTLAAKDPLPGIMSRTLCAGGGETASGQRRVRLHAGI
jgi:Tol biopolymer transport system component